MHDDLIERRLRTTLRNEADALPFTITAAELERRALLRGRGTANRRLGLLLAAAVALGLMGVGGVIGGLFQNPSETPLASGPPDHAMSSASPAAPGTLPSLDELIAQAGPHLVTIAQAHGPADGPETPPADDSIGGDSVGLGDIVGSSEYEVTFACLGSGRIELDVRVPFSRGPRNGPQAACDGAVHREVVRADGARSVALVATARASWRIVIRRLDGSAPMPVVEFPVLEAGDGEEPLVELGIVTMPPHDALAPTDGGMPLTQLQAVPARPDYVVRLWCSGGDAIRYIHGDEVDGVFSARTTTYLDCDGFVHTLALGFPEPFGSRVYVAADPGTRFSVLVSGEQPPVALVRDEPGWQLTGGFGPDLAFDTSILSFTGTGVEGGGPIRIVLACAGAGTIEVSVDFGPVVGEERETFPAECSPGGTVTSRTFDTASEFVDVTYTTSAGTWTAMTVLVPDSGKEGT